MNTDYVKRFEEFVGASGWRAMRTPAQLIEHWDSFVGMCEEGYLDTMYDFENERSVRDLLEAALSDPILRRYDELDVLRTARRSTPGFAQRVVMMSVWALPTPRGGGDACPSASAVNSPRI